MERMEKMEFTALGVSYIYQGHVCECECECEYENECECECVCVCVCGGGEVGCG